MTKNNKPALKADKISPLEESSKTKTITQPKQQEPTKERKTKKNSNDWEKPGPKKKNGANWEKSMIQLDPAIKKLMLQQIAISDTIKTQSIFINEAIKHFVKYLEDKHK